MTAHGPHLHTTYAPAHAHYNPQAYQANVADSRINAQIADNRQVIKCDIRTVNIQQLDVPALNQMLDSLLAQQKAAQNSP